VFRLADVQPNRESKSGTVRIADSTNFFVSKTIAASLVTIKPGGMFRTTLHGAFLISAEGAAIFRKWGWIAPAK
jgi:oxalate decarboxylase/phosphoglucose isomerase-like protein (cupin superfamily)